MEHHNTDTRRPPTTPGVDALFPTSGKQRNLTDVVLRGVGPRSSEWLGDELLPRLLPVQVQAVRDRVREYDASALEDKRLPSLWVQEQLAEVEGVDLLGGLYASVLSEYAVRYQTDRGNDTLPPHSEDADAWLLDESQGGHRALRDEYRDWLCRPGTSTGEFGGDVDELRRGPFAALELADRVRTVRVYLDAPAWAEADDRRPGERALDVLRALGEVARVEVVVSSTRLARTLSQRYDFGDVVEFTEAVNAARSAGPLTDAHESDREAEAFELLDDHYDDGHGDLRILQSLPETGYRWQSVIVDDPVVGLGKSAVSRALGRLDSEGLITRDRASNGQKRVSLTALGRVAQGLLTDDAALRDPLQSTLLGEFTATCRSDAGAVYRAEQGREGGTPGARSAEEWLADTGEAEDPHDFVQWLGGPSDQLDAYAMHKRYAAAARGDLTLVDDAGLQEFDDGRVSYLSAFEDEVLTIHQWGGPLPTLARIASTLLSDLALSKLLAPSRVGREFEQLQDGAGDRILHKFDEALTAVMRDGMQIGWFGEEEHTWDGWRDRIASVRSGCLEKLPDLVGSEEWDEKRELMNDLRGLIGVATQLYRAAGLDVVINVRAPDTLNIERDEVRMKDFCDFFKYTLPLCASYDSSTGVHSYWRQVHETREEKVKWRLPLGLEDEDTPSLASSTNVSWVVAGRTATDLQHDLEASLNPSVRDRVDEGAETAPHLDVAVANGCSFPAIREVVREFASAKGKQVAGAGASDSDLPPPATARDVDELVRLLLAALGDADRPHQANPYDVAEAMMHLASTTRPSDYLDVGDLEYALSQLPPERVFPDSSRSGSKLVQVLLESDEPMGMSELVETAGISERTYHRQLPELESLGLLQKVDRNGYTAWIATLEPWWAAMSSRSEPRGEGTESPMDAWMTESDVVFELACALDLDVDAELFAWPPDLPELYRDPDLRRWRAFIWACVASGDELETGPPDVPTPVIERSVRLGYQPEQREVAQHSLASAVSPDGPKVTDGGGGRSQ